MSRASLITGRKTSWSKTPPSSRMLVGAFAICLIGFLGLTPKSIFGIDLIWPYAALWGAVGWASAGLSLRPMICLCVLGVAQDIAFDGPIGVFLLMNLVTYGVAAVMSETFDVEADALMGLMVAMVAMIAGFFVLWVLASSTVDYVVRLTPILQVWVVTLLLFLPIAGLFRLGGRPGDRAAVT